MKYLKYIRYVLLHKYYVLQAGLKLKVPLLILLIHDWDKFLPFEFFAYANTFFIDETGQREHIENNDFKLAWNAHQKRNKHHWQYWVLMTGGDRTIELLPMPYVYIKEMLADWWGAGRMKNNNPDVLNWYFENADNIFLEKSTIKELKLLAKTLNYEMRKD